MRAAAGVRHRMSCFISRISLGGCHRFTRVPSPGRDSPDRTSGRLGHSNLTHGQSTWQLLVESRSKKTIWRFRGDMANCWSNLDPRRRALIQIGQFPRFVPRDMSDLLPDQSPLLPERIEALVVKCTEDRRGARN